MKDCNKKTQAQQQITISEFLSAFFPDKNEPIWIQPFQPKEEPKKEGLGLNNFEISRNQLQTDNNLKAKLKRLNRKNGIGFIVNSGGTHKVDINKFNAFFAECDEGTFEEQHKKLDTCLLPPSIRLETKKSVHAYWLLSNNDCSAEDWKDIQARLIEYFDADKKLKNLNRCMRLPHFNHVTFIEEDSSYQFKKVEIKEFNPEIRFTVQEMKNSFPEIRKEERTPQNNKSSNSKKESFILDFVRIKDRMPEWKRRIVELIEAKDIKIGSPSNELDGVVFKCPICGISPNGSAILFQNGGIHCRKSDGEHKAEEMAEALGICRQIQNSPNSPNSPFAAQKQKSETKHFPVLNRKALCGIAGEFVNTVYPFTESHEAALLLQFLTCIGNLFGRKGFLDAEGEHYSNLYSMIVGNTSSAKGSSYTQVKKILSEVDANYFESCVKSGISSGEGLIAALDFKNTKDNRLLVVEPEFASVLKRMKREGNTAGTVIREVFDSGDTCVLIKDQLSTKNAHVSIIGHITPDDLSKYLSDTDIGNGFANRFMFAMVRRSKDLPEGGEVPESKKNSLVNRLKKVLEFTNKKDSKFKVVRDEEAREFWFYIYPSLIDEQEGTLGKLKARGRVFVGRLSLIYALLDCRGYITRTDIEAAFAVWQYCNDSLKYIFGRGISLSNDAEKLLTELRVSEEGMSKTAISHLFKRKRSQEKLNKIYAELDNFIRFDSAKNKYFAIVNDGANSENGEFGENGKDSYSSGKSLMPEFEEIGILSPEFEMKCNQPVLDNFEIDEKADDEIIKLQESSADLPISNGTPKEIKARYEYVVPKKNIQGLPQETVKLYSVEAIDKASSLMSYNPELSFTEALFEAGILSPQDLKISPLDEHGRKATLISLQP